MSQIKLISTDFDGTLFAEFENPPIPVALQELIAHLQAQGVKWCINTGRDMSGLLEALARAQISVKPDYLVLVEREIHEHIETRYTGWNDWNDACHHDHKELFIRVRKDLKRLTNWVTSQFDATVYEDAYSPFCLLASSNEDADAIHAYMEEYCAEVPHLTVVRNDVYARFCHAKYNKGTALAEISQRLGISAEHILAAGDHLNDLPILDVKYARYLVTPANGIEQVKMVVRGQKGFVSELTRGHGVAEGIRYFTEGKK